MCKFKCALLAILASNFHLCALIVVPGRRSEAEAWALGRPWRVQPDNVTVQVGRDAHLHCRVEDIGDNTVRPYPEVSWVRRHGQSFELLTFGHFTYSSEERYSLQYQEPNNWVLMIRRVQPIDNGLYECQISAHPPLVRCTNLIVIVPLVEIVDGAGSSVAERFYRRGSTIELACSGSAAGPREGPRARLTWLHGGRALNHDTYRGGVSVKTEEVEGGVYSRLRIAGARRTDAGLYTCALGDKRATVTVHVLSGEHADAMQYGGSGTLRPGGLLGILQIILNLRVLVPCVAAASRGR